MNDEQSLSKIASILASGKAPRTQLNEISDVVHDSGESSTPINDIWKDPNVSEALKDGRSADDIMVIRCPECNRLGYYNQGQVFSCRFGCGSWYCNELFLERNEPVTLADTVTEVTDGYDNESK